MPHEKINYPRPRLEPATDVPASERGQVEQPIHKQLVVGWNRIGWVNVSIYPEGWKHTGEAEHVDLNPQEVDLAIQVLQRAARQAYSTGARHTGFGDVQSAETRPLWASDEHEHVVVHNAYQFAKRSGIAFPAQDGEPRCESSLNVNGEEFRCDGNAGHDGWDHGNRDAHAVWTYEVGGPAQLVKSDPETLAAVEEARKSDERRPRRTLPVLGSEYDEAQRRVNAADDERRESEERAHLPAPKPIACAEHIQGGRCLMPAGHDGEHGQVGLR